MFAVTDKYVEKSRETSYCDVFTLCRGSNDSIQTADVFLRVIYQTIQCEREQREEAAITKRATCEQPTVLFKTNLSSSTS